MKKYIGDLFRFHLLPLCIGVCVTGLFMALFTLYVRSCGSPVQDEIISGTQQRVRGNFSNCVAGPQDELELAAKTVAEKHGIGLGKIAAPLRAALAGKTSTPSVFDMMLALGRDEALARLQDQVG